MKKASATPQKAHRLFGPNDEHALLVHLEVPGGVRRVIVNHAGHALKGLTHHWSQETGWQPVVPAVVLTAQDVNDWNISSMGHDAINALACVKAETKRVGAVYTCPRCEGHGHVWLSEEDKAAAEAWNRTPPPTGDGYQMWETVSEGSPISPVFATALELAQWLSENSAGTVDEGATVEQWMTMIEGDGWAPSAVGTATGITSGIQAVSA